MSQIGSFSLKQRSLPVGAYTSSSILRLSFDAEDPIPRNRSGHQRSPSGPAWALNLLGAELGSPNFSGIRVQVCGPKMLWKQAKLEAAPD